MTFLSALGKAIGTAYKLAEGTTHIDDLGPYLHCARCLALNTISLLAQENADTPPLYLGSTHNRRPPLLSIGGSKVVPTRNSYIIQPYIKL